MYQIEIHTEHPELAALIAAFNEARTAHAVAFHPGDDYFNTQSRRNADPSAWTNRIEHAFDKPAELAKLQLARQESLISCEAALLLAESKLRAVAASERRLEAAVEAAVAATERIGNATPDRWLKDVLKNNIVLAKTGVCFRCHFLARKPEPLAESINQETQPAARAAFKALAEQIEVHTARKCSRDFVGHSFVNLYPLTPASSASAIGAGRLDFDEARFLRVVPVMNEIMTDVPAAQHLVELLDLLNDARRTARDRLNNFKQREKGRVNERQYAERLTRALEHPGTNVKDERDAQHGRRLDYASARTAARAALIAAEGIRMDVVAALKAAVTEAVALEAAFAAASADKQLASRVAIINCLAADCIIRNTGNQLKVMFDETVEDLTGGKGEQALDREYAAIARQYKPDTSQS